MNETLEQILLVDDNSIQAATRKAILERVGFSVKIFLSAQEALLYLQNDTNAPVGLVITDHIMPEMPGTAFVHQLRQSNRLIPVVVLSGLEDAEEEYREYNVIFRVKPIAPDELQALAVRLLHPPIGQTTQTA
ncbi:MAG TPA: response regulator [Acidobacteriaceae bacterium]|nr:response regulator [Acidobacteriaceae bacterium]